MRSFEDIVEEGVQIACDHREDIKRIGLRMLILVAVALVLEVFVFNMNAFRSASYNPVNISHLRQLNFMISIRELIMSILISTMVNQLKTFR